MRAIAATVGADIVLRDLDALSVSRLRRALRYPNPEHVKARMMKRLDDGDVEPFLTACEELADGSVRVPRGAINSLRSTFHLCGIRPQWDDQRSYGTGLFLSLRDLSLRDYQKEGVEALYRNVQGIVVLPCGGGKTLLGVGAIAAVSRSTLVIVPTLDLVEQWQEDISRYLGLTAAIFGAGKHQIGDVTVATADALIRNKKLDLSGFGFALYDECHRIPAKTRLALLRRMPARYRLGLTATPEREDGLTRVIQWSFGDTLLERTAQQLARQGWLRLPKIVGLYTNFTHDMPDSDFEWNDFNQLTDATSEDPNRRATIVDLVKREPTQTWLILSPSRKELCYALADTLRKEGVSAEAITSDLSRTKRKAAMASFRAGTLQCVCATSLADEGLNIKHLSRVILALPERKKGRTAQRIGRIMRPEGDAPIVYDLVDVNVDILKSRWETRKTVYRKLDLEIQECPTLGLFHPTTL